MCQQLQPSPKLFRVDALPAPLCIKLNSNDATTKITIKWKIPCRPIILFNLNVLSLQSMNLSDNNGIILQFSVLISSS